MSDLFSSHYATWSPSNPHGLSGRVRLSPAKLQQDFFFDAQCSAVLAYSKRSELVGHLIFRCFSIAEEGGQAAWISQLVVHSSYRNLGIATRMVNVACSTIPGLKFIGIASSNPYAIKATESGIGGKCSVELAEKWGRQLVNASEVPYLQGKNLRLSTKPGKESSVIDTEFYVDHAVEADRALEELEGWTLGRTREGEEYLGVTMCAHTQSVVHR